MQAGFCVDDHIRSDRPPDCLEHLALDLYVHGNVRIVRETAVSTAELPPVPFGPGEMAVTSCPASSLTIAL